VFSTSEGKNGGGVRLSVLGERESSLYVSNSEDLFAYLAKYVAKEGGDLHFGGSLGGVNFSEFLKSQMPTEGKEIVESARVDWRLFHMNNKRRKR
jgi:hypothetical protein